MSDFAGRLVARLRGTAPLIEPRAPRRFAPEGDTFAPDAGATFAASASIADPLPRAALPPLPREEPAPHAAPGSMAVRPLAPSPQLPAAPDPGAAMPPQTAAVSPLSAQPVRSQPVSPEAPAAAPAHATAVTPEAVRVPVSGDFAGPPSVPAISALAPASADPPPLRRSGERPPVRDDTPRAAAPEAPTLPERVADRPGSVAALSRTDPPAPAEPAAVSPPVIVEIGAIEFRQAAPAASPAPPPAPRRAPLSLEDYLARRRGRR